jgi:2-polyprenyl-3-methyl-5-hydroxy-6-metoxy-1,4-benzoquinol methylase
LTADPYGDEQLVELYDLDNEPGDDHLYYRALADNLNATKILDLGCGTGLLTRALATPGREVIGVDPSPTMLGYARRQPGAEAVTWLDGDASTIARTADIDLIISTGNTMMHIEDYPAVLNSLAAALKPGGVLAFESRNPTARAWEHWGRDETYSERHTPFGHLREWLEVTSVHEGRVAFDAHNVFENGRKAIYTTVLYFRTAAEITTGLQAAGFTNITLHGGWHQEPVSDASRLLVVQATKS